MERHEVRVVKKQSMLVVPNPLVKVAQMHGQLGQTKMWQVRLWNKRLCLQKVMVTSVVVAHEKKCVTKLKVKSSNNSRGKKLSLRYNDRLKLLLGNVEITML